MEKSVSVYPCLAKKCLPTFYPFSATCTCTRAPTPALALLKVPDKIPGRSGRMEPFDTVGMTHWHRGTTHQIDG